MPNFSGVWNLKEQIQAVAAGTWTGLPTYLLYAWGSNGSGRLGLGNVANQSSPVQVGTLGNWSRASTGDSHSVSVKVDGTMWTWGSYSGLGQNDIVDRSSPTQVGALTNWANSEQSFGAGGGFTLAVKTDGTLWAWGTGLNGRLGDGTVVNRSSPVQIGALSNWSRVFAGKKHSVAVKTDGTLWSWGYNNGGPLGDGTVISRSSPVQIGALTNWYFLAASYTTMAVKTDGTLWSWGNGTSGVLGGNATANRSSPVQVGALTNWSAVSCANKTAASVKTDGTLWAWGYNAQGQLGQSNTIYRSSPVQVGALTNWSRVGLNGNACAVVSLKTDGTLWAWGHNNVGQVGDSTTINKSSPIQVGALANWSQVSAGNYFNLAILQGTSN